MHSLLPDQLGPDVVAFLAKRPVPNAAAFTRTLSETEARAIRDHLMRAHGISHLQSAGTFETSVRRFLTTDEMNTVTEALMDIYE